MDTSKLGSAKHRKGKKGKYSHPDRMVVNMRSTRIGMFECFYVDCVRSGTGSVQIKTSL